MVLLTVGEIQSSAIDRLADMLPDEGTKMGSCPAVVDDPASGLVTDNGRAQRALPDWEFGALDHLEDECPGWISFLEVILDAIRPNLVVLRFAIEGFIDKLLGRFQVSNAPISLNEGLGLCRL